jgi:NADPH2:quinone reductase
MQALIITALSGPSALQIQQVADPEPKPDQSIIRVSAAGLNFADIMTTQGGYPGAPPPPLIAGREFAGIEESTGRRVMGYAQYAAFAEKIAAHQHMLWPVPESWTNEQAAAFPVNYFTAYLAYWQSGLVEGDLGEGSMWGRTHSPVHAEQSSAAASDTTPARRTPRVLIHAAAGGVGTAAVQIGKILGIEMYGTSSSDEKLEKVQALGLTHPINYKQRDYEEAIKTLTNNEGVDAVFEMLGGEHTAKSLRCLRDFGRVIQYGSATGQPPQLDLRAMYAKSGSLQGLWLTYLSQKKEIMDPAWAQLSTWIAEGKLAPQIGQAFPLSQAVEAYKLLQAGKNYGKVILKIG